MSTDYDFGSELLDAAFDIVAEIIEDQYGIDDEMIEEILDYLDE